MGRSPIWAGCEDFGHTYNGYFPLLCWPSQLKVGWIDQLVSALQKWGKQRMPGSCERGIVTVRRFFDVLCMDGSAFREPWWSYQKINERNTGSLAKGRRGSCRYL